jgi:hypothetical protein
MTVNPFSHQFRYLRILAEILSTISLVSGRISLCEIQTLLTTGHVRKTYRADLKFHRQSPGLSHDRDSGPVPSESAIASEDPRRFTCRPDRHSSASIQSSWLSSNLPWTSWYLSVSWPASLNGARLSFTSQEYSLNAVYRLQIFCVIS